MDDRDLLREYVERQSEQAFTELVRRHVDLVVACRYIPEFYLRPSLSKMLAKNDAFKDFAPHFVMRLMKNTAPEWLKRAAIPGLDNYVVYAVVPSNVDGKNPRKPK